jgi:hypothetical protein
MRTESQETGELAISARATPRAIKRNSLLIEALLWFVWFPVSLILLVLVLERFILSEALF